MWKKFSFSVKKPRFPKCVKCTSHHHRKTRTNSSSDRCSCRSNDLDVLPHICCKSCCWEDLWDSINSFGLGAKWGWKFEVQASKYQSRRFAQTSRFKICEKCAENESIHNVPFWWNHSLQGVGSSTLAERKQPQPDLLITSPKMVEGSSGESREWEQNKTMHQRTGSLYAAGVAACEGGTCSLDGVVIPSAISYSLFFRRFSFFSRFFFSFFFFFLPFWGKKPSYTPNVPWMKVLFKLQGTNTNALFSLGQHGKRPHRCPRPRTQSWRASPALVVQVACQRALLTGLWSATAFHQGWGRPRQITRTPFRQAEEKFKSQKHNHQSREHLHEQTMFVSCSTLFKEQEGQRTGTESTKAVATPINKMCVASSLQ